MKAIEYLKQNAFNIASFFGFSGAALFALLGEGASMAAEYPAPAAANSSTRTNRAVTLAEKGILWFTQPIGESFPLYVREDVITEIREHRSEWLGM